MSCRAGVSAPNVYTVFIDATLNSTGKLSVLILVIRVIGTGYQTFHGYNINLSQMKLSILIKLKIFINKLRRIAARAHDNLTCTGQIVVTVSIMLKISVSIRCIRIGIFGDR